MYYDVEKIKQIPLPVIAERETQTTLNPRGNSRCPCAGCGEKQTRFTYYPQTNTFKCWYSGAGGTSIDLVKHIRGIASNADAMAYLNEVYLGGGTVEPPAAPMVEQPPTPPARLDCEVYGVLLDMCRGVRDSDIETYLDGRGITAPLREKYKIRIIPAGGVADVRGELIKRFGVDRLKSAGIISPNGGWFVFSEYRLLLPATYGNRCLSLSGRVTDATNPDRPKYRYLGGVPRVPYLLDNMDRARGCVYLVEGFFDAVSASELGHPAIGLGSCNYSREYYKRLLKKIAANGLAVVFAFDNDTAGAKAIQETKLDGQPLAEYCAGINLQAYYFKYADLQGCKDWNDYYRQTRATEMQLVRDWAANTPLQPGEQPTTAEIISRAATATGVPRERAAEYINNL